MAPVTSKGQITIPAEVRRALGLQVGSVVNFIPTKTGTYELAPAARSVKDLEGILAYSGKPKTLEEIEQDIAEAVAGDALQ
jgi:AbrB family looped-hinge helix DNA binding protein